MERSLFYATPHDDSPFSTHPRTWLSWSLTVVIEHSDLDSHGFGVPFGAHPAIALLRSCRLTGELVVKRNVPLSEELEGLTVLEWRHFNRRSASLKAARNLCSFSTQSLVQSCDDANIAFNRRWLFGCGLGMGSPNRRSRHTEHHACAICSAFLLHRWRSIDQISLRSGHFPSTLV